MRQLAILLLTDEHGISAASWAELRVLLSSGDEENDDIFESVTNANGRYSLPADFE